MATRRRKPPSGRDHLFIDQWLDAKGLSYEQVGERMNVSRTTVWRWSKEQHRLDPGKMQALSKAMRLDRVEDLFRLPDTPAPPPPRPSVDAVLEKADDKTHKAVIELARRLTSSEP